MSDTQSLTPTAENRDRWSSRLTFVLGAIGSAVGLGNLWRFPYLSFSFGGGSFLIPYILAFFFFGVPLCLLELTLGRNFQGGDPVCFNSLHPRLVGIGWMSAYASFIVAAYYCVVIGWCVIYFIESFQSPLPWSGVTFDPETNTTSSNANSHFYGDILMISESAEIQLTTNYQVVLATLFVWVCVYVSIFKGVGVVSKVVKFSVPIPLILLFVLLINSAVKDGASDGIEAYIGRWDTAILGEADIWQAALGQIFFSIGVCFGVMTAYSSYMESRSGIMMDTIVIAGMNSVISIFAGFVVFTAVGVLAFELGVEDWAGNSPEALSFQGGLKGPGLVFTSYPYALSVMDTAPNFFSLLFFASVFLLAIDSAFSIVEAVTTAVHDTNLGQTFSREIITLGVCVSCASFGMFFCTDNGLYMLDVVDYYMNNYIMLGVGALECIGATWVFGYKESVAQLGEGAVRVYNGCFSMGVLLLIIFFNALVPDAPLEGEEEPMKVHILVSLICFFGCWLVGMFWSKSLAEKQDDFFYNMFFSGGSFKLHEMMIKGEYDTGADGAVPVPSMKFNCLLHVWAFFIKYSCPVLLILVSSAGIRSNKLNPYEGYVGVVQNLGHFEVLVAWMIFLFFLVVGQDMYTNRTVVETETGFQVVYDKGSDERSKTRVENEEEEEAQVIDESGVSKV